MSTRYLSLILILLSIFFASVYASEEGVDFSQIRENVEKDSSPALKQVSPSDSDIVEAKKQSTLAYLKNVERYYSDEIEHRKKEWDHRLESFNWHFWTSIFIFIVVVTLMLAGLYFSYMQFKASNYGQSEHSDHSTQIKISRDGVEISSSVIGLLVLFLSLGFFYLYLKEVYPLQTIQDPPASKQMHRSSDNDGKLSDTADKT